MAREWTQRCVISSKLSSSMKACIASQLAAYSAQKNPVQPRDNTDQSIRSMPALQSATPYQDHNR
eukprot:scaffold189586_cov14-Prasinocladus_malaysianus.AAC.1